MGNLFEIPELLTLDGVAFSGESATGSREPNSCGQGCDKGCIPGGCFPGSATTDIE